MSLDYKEAAGIIACGLIRVFCNFSNLLHYQLLCRVAEHDGVNALRQIAYIYSQSLLNCIQDILFEFASLNIEQIHRRLFFQALDFQYCISIRRIRIQRNFDCVASTSRNPTNVKFNVTILSHPSIVCKVWVY